MLGSTFLAVVGLLTQTPAAAGHISVSMQTLEKGSYALEGQFTVASSKGRAWGVLTDYEHIPRFVSSMRLSKIIHHDKDSILLEQESVARALFVRRTIHVILQVREEPKDMIRFEDVSKTSFESYEGSWRLEEVAEGVRVTYRLNTKGGAFAPKFVARGTAKKMVLKLLKEVRSEILRRAKGSNNEPPRPH